MTDIDDNIDVTQSVEELEEKIRTVSIANYRVEVKLCRSRMTRKEKITLDTPTFNYDINDYFF